jgi:hypothetical protein
VKEARILKLKDIVTDLMGVSRKARCWRSGLVVVLLMWHAQSNSRINMYSAGIWHAPCGYLNASHTEHKLRRCTSYQMFLYLFMGGRFASALFLDAMEK